jgi:signal transduction histidine kinase
MSIIYNIVTSLLGGKISVHSELGEGTMFVLDLPLSVELALEPALV